VSSRIGEDNLARKVSVPPAGSDDQCAIREHRIEAEAGEPIEDNHVNEMVPVAIEVDGNDGVAAVLLDLDPAVGIGLAGLADEAGEVEPIAARKIGNVVD